MSALRIPSPPLFNFAAITTLHVPLLPHYLSYPLSLRLPILPFSSLSFLYHHFVSLSCLTLSLRVPFLPPLLVINLSYTCCLCLPSPFLFLPLLPVSSFSLPFISYPFLFLASLPSALPFPSSSIFPLAFLVPVFFFLFSVHSSSSLYFLYRLFSFILYPFPLVCFPSLRPAIFPTALLVFVIFFPFLPCPFPFVCFPSSCSFAPLPRPAPHVLPSCLTSQHNSN